LHDNVYIVVLNWNRWPDTAACLASLQRLHYEHYKVVVVDNGSTNDSTARLRNDYPWITLIETGRNLGFAGGCNAGIRRALSDGADFVWLLNNDTTADSEALRFMVEAANRDPRIAAVGSAIYDMHEPRELQAWGGGHINFLLGRSRHFLNPVSDREIDYITGASLLLRRSALQSVGLLDEGFFFSWEDADLGMRLRRAKWKLAVAGESKIWHKETASLSGKDAVLDAYFNQAANRFFRKHALVPQIPVYVGVALRVAKRLMAGDWERARAVWTACRRVYP
jgi:GT2 family glycosyltransferase